MTSELDEIMLCVDPLADLFFHSQAGAHRNLYQPVIQWCPCWLDSDNASSATALPLPRKEVAGHAIHRIECHLKTRIRRG